MPGPIKPSEVDKRNVIPQTVFEIVNVLVTCAWDGTQAIVRQEEIVSRISQDLGISRSAVFDGHFLDFEDAYRKVGWTVEYDKPGYNEPGEALFVFRKKRRR